MLDFTEIGGIRWNFAEFCWIKKNLGEFKKKALENKIVVREGYLPLHKHPFFKDHNKLSLPNSEKLGKETVDIPSSFNLKENEIISIGHTLKNIAKSLI